MGRNQDQARRWGFELVKVRAIVIVKVLFDDLQPKGKSFSLQKEQQKGKKLDISAQLRSLL